MGLGEAIMATLAIGLSAASYFLGQSMKGPKPKIDFTPTTLSTQGMTLPYLIGRERLGYILAWAGNRFTTSESVGGSGGGGLFGKGSKKKGGAAAQKQTVYYESAWHQICVGPAQALHRIWQDGKVIWEGYINAQDDPSGSTFVAQDGSEFAIYWGEPDQPIDSTISAGVGIPSRWPHICYVVWYGKRLGTSPRWPQIEYDIETLVYTVRANTDLPDLAVTFDPRIETMDYGGPNPAWIVWQMLFETYPHGAGLDWSLFSIAHGEAGEGGTVWTAMSLMEAAQTFDTEGLVLRVVASENKKLNEVLADLMQDAGLMWMRHYDDVYALSADYKGLNAFKVIRAEAATALPTEAVFPVEPEIDTKFDEVPVDRAVFTWHDVNRQFKNGSIAIDEDGQASEVNNVRAASITLVNVIHQPVANMVAERRSQEELAGGGKATVYMGRESRKFIPGSVFSFPGLPVTMRLTDVEADVNDDKVKLTLIQDHYGAAPSTFVRDEVLGSIGDTGTPTDNELHDFFEVPGFIGEPGKIFIVPLRVRGDTRMSMQVIHLSLDGSTYLEVNRDQTVQSGGVLTEDLDATGWIIESGPSFDASGTEILDVAQDYSADEATWRLGRQMCLIGEELFFLRNVEALGGNSYRLRGLIRARGDTERAAHAIDDPVFIFLFDETEPFFDVSLAPNRLLYIKQQAAGGGPGAVALGSVTADSKTLVGKGITPMRPGALRVTAPKLCVNEVPSGSDISLEWSYRSLAVPGTGAGLWNLGDPIGLSPVEGKFELEFLDDMDVSIHTVDENTLNQDLTYTIANADLVTWFGGEPSLFKIRLRNVNVGFRSNYVERIITIV